MHINTNNLRQIVLDTETTGMNKTGVHYEGHRIIEIGAVELINRRLTGNHFHAYLKPDRPVDPEAYAVHGISDAFLTDKPEFKTVKNDFINFIAQAELIIHNAPFDIGFLNYELQRLNKHEKQIENYCQVIDSLVLARKLFPGKRNNLDALCERYNIDNSRRTLHGALLDAEILADVYLAMTGGQTSLSFSAESRQTHLANDFSMANKVLNTRTTLKVIHASDKELSAHNDYLNLIQKEKGECIWKK